MVSFFHQEHASKYFFIKKMVDDTWQVIKINALKFASVSFQYLYINNKL